MSVKPKEVKMVSNEIYHVSKYGIINNDEAEYYINSIKTAAALVKLAGIEDKNDTMKSVVFEKIASNIFWLKEEPNRLYGVFGKDNEAVSEDEKNVQNNDENAEHEPVNEEVSQVDKSETETFDGETIHPDSVLGERLKIYGVVTNEESGEALIHTDRGVLRTFSKVLIKSVTKGDVGKIETRVSNAGRKYYVWVSELKQYNDMAGITE